jgi:4-hydroxybenzoate polyprenyltransferase/phosphoserine phosphatase
MSLGAASPTKVAAGIPLVVDVDGTLVKTDLLHEAALQFLARFPWRAPELAAWLMKGKSHLKTQLADEVNPGIESVPLRPEVLALIREAQSQGRPVYLASASDRRYVQELGDRVGGLAGVFGTDSERGNLAGPAKASQLVEAFGPGGFDYIGDQPADFPVWRQARQVLAVTHSGAFTTRLLKGFPNAEIVARSRPSFGSYVRGLRVHQWAKNSLVFLPMILGHRFGLETFAATVVGFFCFCFAASSAYVANDLLDLPGDRDHPRKARRPYAAGDVPVTHGILLSVVLMVAAFGLAMLLPQRFLLVLSIYVATTLGYSFYFKRKLLVDVVVLGGLYTLRIFGGLAAIDVYQTQWLLMFSLFLFLSLAIVKRCSELVAKRADGKTTVMGRGYRIDDLAILFPLAAAAGYGSVFVVALYMSSPEVRVLYHYPDRLWLMCPLLLYWISRVLMLANRGELHDDPVVFALTDRKSWVTGALMGAVVAVSI